MSDIIDNAQVAAIIYPKIDTEFLTDTLNASDMNDLSNLGLNEDEAIAYTNIMNARKVKAALNGDSVSFIINYDDSADPANFLEVLTEGQPAPEITGIVHLPQGGTRPTNVIFWEPGQLYEEGAKEPVFFKENDMSLLQQHASVSVEDAAGQSHAEIAELAKSGILNEITNWG